MKISFFGRLGDRIGREIDVDLPGFGCSVADLRRHLAELYPAAADDLGARTVRACVDEAIVPDTYTIEPGQRVEFFPPLSGG